MESRTTQTYHIALDCVDAKADSTEFRNRAALAFVTGDVSAGEKETGVKITYANLKVLTNRAAGAFQELGLKAGTRIVLRLPNVPEFVIALFGALKAGLVVVPVPHQSTTTELKKICAHAKAAVLVSKNDATLKTIAASPYKSLKKIFTVSAKGEKIPARTTRLQEALLAQSENFATLPVKSETPALCLYTSGTGGRIKAVLHAHGVLLAHDTRATEWLGLSGGGVVFNTSNLNWSYALTCGLLNVLRRGATSLIYDGPPEPANLVHFTNRFGVTTFMSVPALYKRLTKYLRSHHIEFSSLQHCLSAADILDEATREEFFRLTGRQIHQGFGMTEHSIYVYQPILKDPTPNSIGRPYDSEKIKILKDDLTAAGPGETGVIATREDAPGLFLGYADENFEPKRPLKNGWFLSGDTAYQNAAGDFFFTGRMDDILNLNGHRVSPVEVESVIAALPQIAECAVTQIKVRGKTYALAALVLKGGVKKTSALLKTVQNHCTTHLAPYKIPKKFVVLKALPKTRNEKLRRGLVAGRARG